MLRGLFRLTVVVLASVPLAACARRTVLEEFSAGGFVECSFESWATSWLDSNGNGRWDEGEPPLGGIQVAITGPAFPTRTRITDSTGKLEFSLFAAGCNRPRFAFVAMVPDGFALTTARRRVAVSGETVSFGFARRGA